MTICTHNRKNILSHIQADRNFLYPFGEIVQTQMAELEKRYSIEISPYIIMSDHVHMIIKIARAEQSPAPTVSDMICTFKSLTTKIANTNDNCPGRKLWQRGYFEHVIRDEQDYLAIMEYMQNNPLKEMIPLMK